MLNALKIVLLLVLVTALVWLSTLWRWNRTQTDPSGPEMLLHLVPVPLAFTAALLLAIWLVQKIRKTLESPVTPPAPPPAPGSALKPVDKLSAD